MSTRKRKKYAGLFSIGKSWGDTTKSTPLADMKAAMQEIIENYGRQADYSKAVDFIWSRLNKEEKKDRRWLHVIYLVSLGQPISLNNWKDLGGDAVIKRDLTFDAARENDKQILVSSLTWPTE